MRKEGENVRMIEVIRLIAWLKQKGFKLEDIEDCLKFLDGVPEAGSKEKS